jgi:hypothetical protein
LRKKSLDFAAKARGHQCASRSCCTAISRLLRRPAVFWAARHRQPPPQLRAARDRYFWRVHVPVHPSAADDSYCLGGVEISDDLAFDDDDSGMHLPGDDALRPDNDAAGMADRPLSVMVNSKLRGGGGLIRRGNLRFWHRRTRHSA